MANEADEVDPDTYWFNVWFMGTGSWDVMIQLYRDKQGLFFVARLRIYDPSRPHNDPWSGLDYKKWLRYRITEGADAVMKGQQAAEDLLTSYAMMMGGEITVRDRLDIYGKGEALHAKLSQVPWCHVKTGTKEDLEAIKESMKKNRDN